MLSSYERSLKVLYKFLESWQCCRPGKTKLRGLVNKCRATPLHDPPETARSVFCSGYLIVCEVWNDTRTIVWLIWCVGLSLTLIGQIVQN